MVVVKEWVKEDEGAWRGAGGKYNRRRREGEEQNIFIELDVMETI